MNRNEALDTLHDISQTERRSSAAYGYRLGAPHLFQWGVIWLLGYGVSYWRPTLWQIWPVLVLVGVIGSTIIGMRMRPAASRTHDWRYTASVVATFVFICAVLAIMPPRAPERVGAFVPILVALYYALVGIWTRGSRMLILGTAVAALTLAGFFFFPQTFALWMAIVGGGGLILGGLWLRSV
jgi:hypothetical protein